MKMKNDILQVTKLNKRFDKFEIKDVDFSIEKGTVMGLIGQNGSGKTTIIKLIMNVFGRNSGSISANINGEELDNLRDEIRFKDSIGYVADEDYLYYNSTLACYAKAFEAVYSSWDGELFESLCEKWKLEKTKKFSTFSKGMKTKAMLALTLAHKPELLILDEPTSGLDPVARIEVLDLLRDFVSDGEKSVLFSTHITGDLDKIADYITMINNGRVLESMSVDKIEEKYAVICGDISDLGENRKLLIGVRETGRSFEGLVLRNDLSEFKNVSVKNPNVENLLTFSIWGSGQEVSHND